jgi:hypothetical protein
MAKFTPAYLKKLEDVLKEGGYEVRYEKGNFKSGYCLLELKKVVVVNKFSTLESRIQALLEIINQLSTGGQLVADLRSIGLKNPIRNQNPELQDTVSLFDGNEPLQKEEPVADAETSNS